MRLNITIPTVALALMASISVYGQKSDLETQYHVAKNQESKNAGYYFDKATEKAQAGKYVEAVDLYDKCIKIDPVTYDAYYDRGYCKMRLQDYNAAIEDFTTCLRLHKTPYANGLYLRGSCFLAIKKYDEAIVDLSKALDISSNPDIWAARGEAYMKTGDYQDAVADFTDAIAKKSDNIQLFGDRAICQYRAHHLQEAIADADKFLAAQPASPLVVETELRAKYELKDYAGALQLSQTLINLQPNAQAYYYKGLMEFNMAEYQDAAGDFTNSLKLDSTDRNAYYSRALCQMALNDDIKGCQDLKMARKYGFPNLDAKIQAICNYKKGQ